MITSTKTLSPNELTSSSTGVQDGDTSLGDTTQPMSPMRTACSHPSPSEPKLRAQAQKHPGRVTCHGSPRLCSPLPASRPPPHCLRKCPCRVRPPCLTQGHCTCPSLVAQLQSCLLCPTLCLPEPIHPKYLLIASPALPPPLALTQQSFPTSHGPGGVSSRPFLTLTPLSLNASGILFPSARAVRLSASITSPWKPSLILLYLQAGLAPPLCSLHLLSFRHSQPVG